MHTTNKTFLLLRRAAHWTACVGVLLFVMVMAAACSSDSGNEELEADDPSTIVTLTININSPQNGVTASKPFTRSTQDDYSIANGDEGPTWNDNYHSQTATRYEDSIDVNNLHLIFYDESDNYFIQAEHIRVTKIEGSKITIRGVLNVRLDTEKSNKLFSTSGFTGKVAVFANVETPGNGVDWNTNKLSDLIDQSVFSYVAPTTSDSLGNYVAGMKTLPMFGILGISEMKFTKGGTTPLGEIPVLRSVAKVSVHFTNEMRLAGFKIKSVKIDRYNACGSIAPSSTSLSASGITTVKDLTYFQSFHIPSAPQYTESALTFQYPTTDKYDTVSLNLYIPEYQNVSGGTEAGNPMRIVVEVTRDVPGAAYESGEKTLVFRDYTSGNSGDATTAYDIVRNHHYRFFIYNEHLDARLYVEPWQVIRHRVKDI